MSFSSVAIPDGIPGRRPVREMISRRPVLAASMLISAVTAICYLNSLSVPFHFDDINNILRNPLLKTPIKILMNPVDNRMIGLLSLSFNYMVGGQNPFGYHIVNTVIHALNGIVLFILVGLLLASPRLRDSVNERDKRLIALSASLLFVSHPVQTQAVTYIVQRFASLCALFYLISMAAYLRFRISSRGKAGYYVISLIAAVLAMKTKEIAFTLPIAIFTAECLFFEGRWKGRLIGLFPFILTISIIPLSLIGISRPAGGVVGDISAATRVDTSLSRIDYLMTQVRIIPTYFRLLLFPFNLNLDYDYPLVKAPWNGPFILSAILLCGLLAAGLLLLRRGRKRPELLLVSFGIFFFFIALSVESSIIPIRDVIFEHRLYLPGAGFFMAFPVLLLVLERNLPKRKVPFMITAVLVLSVMLAAGTILRNAVWQSEIGFWKDVVRKSPRIARPHNNLGHEYLKKGMYLYALNEFLTAISLDPLHVSSYNNAGQVYLETGDYEKAEKYLKAAIDLSKDYADPHINLGVLYNNTGEYDGALAEFGQALKLRPDDAGIYSNMGISYSMLKRFGRAVDCFKEALRLNPGYADAYNNMGRAYLEAGDANRAVSVLTEAIRLNPSYLAAHFNLANAYLNLGLRDGAEFEYRFLAGRNSSLAEEIEKRLKQ